MLVLPKENDQIEITCETFRHGCAALNNTLNAPPEQGEKRKTVSDWFSNRAVSLSIFYRHRHTHTHTHALFLSCSLSFSLPFLLPPLSLSLSLAPLSLFPSALFPPLSISLTHSLSISLTHTISLRTGEQQVCQCVNHQACWWGKVVVSPKRNLWLDIRPLLLQNRDQVRLLEKHHNLLVVRCREK